MNSKLKCNSYPPCLRKRVLIEKISSKIGPKHPNGIVVGHTVQGLQVYELKIGLPLVIDEEDHRGQFHTSPIQKINEDVTEFETLTGTYSYKVLEKKEEKTKNGN